MIDLFCVSVKSSIGNDRKFELVTSSTVYEFKSVNKESVSSWVTAIEGVCRDLVHSRIGSANDFVSLPANESKEGRSEDDPILSSLFKVMRLPGNTECADCGASGKRSKLI